MLDVEQVMARLDSGVLRGRGAECLELVGGRSVLVVDIDGLPHVEAVDGARAALEGAGWTCYATCVREGPEELPFRLAAREWHQRSSSFAPGDPRAPAEWSPDEILAAADALTDADVANQLARLERESTALWRDDMDVVLHLQIGSTRSRVGDAPDVEDIPARARSSPASLDRWLLRWEVASGCSLDASELPGWVVDHGNGSRLVAVPWERTEAVLAVDQFWAAPTPLVVALLKRWAERYGTHVVGLYGNSLCLRSTRLPTGIAEAYDVARAIDLVSNDLVGTYCGTRRGYALGLLHERRWWLASRL